MKEALVKNKLLAGTFLFHMAGLHIYNFIFYYTEPLNCNNFIFKKSNTLE